MNKLVRLVLVLSLTFLVVGCGNNTKVSFVETTSAKVAENVNESISETVAETVAEKVADNVIVNETNDSTALLSNVNVSSSNDSTNTTSGGKPTVYFTKDITAESLVNRINQQHGEHTLEHAVEIGLGSREYELVSID